MSAVDSGYNSETDSSSKLPPSKHAVDSPAPETAIDPAVEEHVSLKRRRVNSEPTITSRSQISFYKGAIADISTQDHPQYEKAQPSRASVPEYNSQALRDPDLEIISAQHQIAMARQRLHSHSGLTRPTDRHHVAAGWTAGPRSACTSNIFDRLFDGVRIMSHEHSLLASLGDGPALTEGDTLADLPIDLSPAEKREVEDQVQYAGFAMPVSLEEEDGEAEIVAQDENQDIDDFFKLDEASTPEKEL